MTEAMRSESRAALHPTITDLAAALVRDAGARAALVNGDDGNWLAIEESAGAMTFVEAEGSKLRIVPFLGEGDAVGAHPFVHDIRPSWLEGERELVVDVSALSSYADRGQVMDLMHAALDYWTLSAAAAERDLSSVLGTAEPLPPPEIPKVDFAEAVLEQPVDLPADVPASGADAQLRADISDQWSWASSAARIPQISDLTVALSEAVAQARISIAVRDADLLFGTALAFEGALDAGTTALGSVNVPLSARVMSQVEERRAADCVITLEDAATGRVLSRFEEAIDIQPRDLWFWQGTHAGPSSGHACSSAARIC